MGTALYEQFQREQAGEPDPASLYEQYRAEQAKPAARVPLNLPKIGADATSALPRNRMDASGDFEVIGRAAAGNLANIAQGLPGMRAVQAGARAAVRGQPYREALSDIDAATNAIPTPLRIAERMAGAAPLAALLPASTMAQAAKSGAALGAADQALDANPDLSIGERAAHTATGAAIGGATGAALAGGAKALDKGREMVGLAKRVKNATPLDEAAVADAKATVAADKVNYGKADAEAAANGGTSPVLASVLERPRIKKYVDMVRDGEEGSPTSDAEVATEVYKFMSKARRGMKATMERNGYDPALDREITKLAGEMKKLKDATAAVSTKPALTMDIDPETFTVEPQITPGREAMAGPVPAARGNLTPRVYHGAQRPFAEFSDAHIAVNNQYGPGHYFADSPDVAGKWATMGAGPDAQPNIHAARLRVANPFDMDANALPETKRLVVDALSAHGVPQEKLSRVADAIDNRGLWDGMVAAFGGKSGDPAKATVQLLKDSGFDGITSIEGGPGFGSPRHRIYSAFSAEQIVPALGPVPSVGNGLLKDITEAPNPSLSQALRNFRGNRENAMQGPQGPAFQLRGQPDKVTPGVTIETPAMRVQTAPAEEVPAVMPSFPEAVAEHARMKGNRAAFETAAERTNKIMRGTRVPAKKLGTESPAAWMEQILGMSPEEADAALRGTLGEAKGQAGYRLPRDASIVGAIKELGGPAQRLNRIAPFVRALDEQAGNAAFQPMNLQQYLRYLATLNGPIANP